MQLKKLSTHKYSSASSSHYEFQLLEGFWWEFPQTGPRKYLQNCSCELQQQFSPALWSWVDSKLRDQATVSRESLFMLTRSNSLVMMRSVHVKNCFVYMGGNSSPPSKFIDSTNPTTSSTLENFQSQWKW